MVELTIDGKKVEVQEGSMVMHAAHKLGVYVPHFCYHKKLSVAANCRMCLVEVEKAPKAMPACATPATNGMVVHTCSERAVAAQKSVMEFLLINHPLDCPICDQGGECDLQDQAMAYGVDASRYAENKRAVENKYIGALVKTIMTRCIHCTRCIRFTTEVAGTAELGATNRGEHMEVGTYVEKALTSELSGNLIDICPVGALTSRPYAFVSRPWELRKADSIDVLDAVGTNIRIDTRSGEVLRVLPRVHEDVNEEWLADRGRFSFDGLKRKRVDRPWVRKDGKLVAVGWAEAFDVIAARLAATKGERIGALAGDLADVESALALKELLAGLGSNNLDCRTDGAAIDASRRDFYSFNTSIAGIEEADALLIIGSNPRTEAPVLNARIRKRAIAGNFPVGVVGPRGLDLTYASEWLGEGGATLRALASGAHPFCETLRKAKNPMLILGRHALTRADGATLLAVAWQIAAFNNMLRPDWHGFNLLHRFGGQHGALDVGFVSGLPMAKMLSGSVDALWVLGADGLDLSSVPANTFVVVQGHHGEAAVARADVVLPGAAYTEKDAAWVNTEGRVQLGYQAVPPPGEAREDWKIIRAMSGVMGKPLGYDTLEALRARLVAAYPVFDQNEELPRVVCTDAVGPAGDIANLRDDALALPPGNYWQQDPISRASETMAECARTYAAPAALAAE